jgi:hypothetical protein
VDAQITQTEAILSVDGQQVGYTSGTFVPAAKDLTIGDRPAWANAPTSYRVDQATYKVQMGATVVSGTAGTLSDPVLSLFELPPSKKVPFKTASDGTLTLEATFEVLPATEESLNGLVDRYGQAVAASWPQKIKTDADLQASLTNELQRIKSWAPAR